MSNKYLCAFQWKFRTSLERKLFWTESPPKMRRQNKLKDTKNDQLKMYEVTLTEDMKNAIRNAIKIIEVKLAATNTVNEILKEEENLRIETLNQVLGQYKGRGKVSKNTIDTSLKFGNTGFCSIDALLNLFRKTELTNLQHHKLCDHKLRCSLCIVRSALLKVETSKEKKKQVKLQEIEKNLKIFLGNNYCLKCFTPNGNGQFGGHNCPLIKPAEISLKVVLDNFLHQPEVPQNFGLKLKCENCYEDLSSFSEGYFKVRKGICKNGKLSSGVLGMVNEIQKVHTEKSKGCINSKIKINCMSNNLLVFMEAKSVTHFEKKISIGSDELHYAGQVNYNTGLLSNHFSTTSETQKGTFIEYSGKNSKVVGKPNISKSVLMLYIKERITVPTEDFVYKKTAIKYFSYDQEAKRKKKEEYDPVARNKRHQDEYDSVARNKRHQDEYDPVAAKETRTKALLKSKHKTGIESVCVSCTRWGNNPRIIINEQDIKSKFTKVKTGLFFLHEDLKLSDGKWRMCTSCYSGFKNEKVPRLNMKTLNDYINIGSIPYELPKLNTLEAYLIKLRIPFLRLANMPRSPNLKVFGSMVCVSANIEESMQKIEHRLSLQHETLIPVNFKRKLSFTGSYLSKIIDAKKVFVWLDYLKKNNPLYADLVYDKVQICKDITAYENQLLREAAMFDDQNKNDSENINEENDEEIEDSSEDEVSDDEKNEIAREYVKEDAIDPQDTLLIDVLETNIDENSVTNRLAEIIIEKEKDIFYSDDESDTSETFYSDDESTPEAVSGEAKPHIQVEPQKTYEKKKKERTIKQTKPFTKKKNSKKEQVLNVAPGEGGKIDNRTKYGEAECFPELFPTGKGTYLSYVESRLYSILFFFIH